MKSYAEFFPGIPDLDTHLQRAFDFAELNTPARQALFLATVAHESNFLKDLEEDMNYSAKRLGEVWPDRFKNTAAGREKAKIIQRKPIKIAEAVYGGRMGNAPEGFGDGWRFRGSGPGMLTGKDNFIMVDKTLGLNGLLVKDPALVRTVSYGILAFAAWWKLNRMNRQADDIAMGYLTTGYDPWVLARKKVQGGTLGMENVKMLYKKFTV